MKMKNNINWFIIDAKSNSLGRVASLASIYLMGKYRADFSHTRTFNDHIVIINSKKVKLTGKKEQMKTYQKHTGYIGNLKTKGYLEQKKSDSNIIIINAISGMIPKNNLHRTRMSHLHVYNDEKHLHNNIKLKAIKVWKS